MKLSIYTNVFEKYKCNRTRRNFCETVAKKFSFRVPTFFMIVARLKSLIVSIYIRLLMRSVQLSNCLLFPMPPISSTKNTQLLKLDIKEWTGEKNAS